MGVARHAVRHRIVAIRTRAEPGLRGARATRASADRPAILPSIAQAILIGRTPEGWLRTPSGFHHKGNCAGHGRMRDDDGRSDNMRIASALSTRLLSRVPHHRQGRGRQKRPLVTLSYGPYSGERAARNGVARRRGAKGRELWANTLKVGPHRLAARSSVWGPTFKVFAHAPGRAAWFLSSRAKGLGQARDEWPGEGSLARQVRARPAKGEMLRAPGMRGVPRLYGRAQHDKLAARRPTPTPARRAAR